MKATTDDVLCHISQYDNHHDSVLFILVESNAILPATSVASAAGRDELVSDWRKPISESALVTNIISAREVNKRDFGIITSSNLANKTWIIRFSEDRTLRITSDEFLKLISSVGSMTYCSFDSGVNNLVVTNSVSSNPKGVDVQRDILAANVELNAVAGTLFRVGNTVKGLSDGAVRASASIKSSTRTLKILKDEFDNWKGPIAESTIRSLVAKGEGEFWAESRRFRSLDDVLLWIGESIGAKERDIDHARAKIVSALIFDFVGFNEDKTALVCPFHLMGTSLL